MQALNLVIKAAATATNQERHLVGNVSTMLLDSRSYNLSLNIESVLDQHIDTQHETCLFNGYDFSVCHSFVLTFDFP